MLIGAGSRLVRKPYKKSRHLFVKVQYWGTMIRKRSWYFNDTSLTGQGASLLQNGQPIGFLSRALNAETRYAQIEEILAIVFNV